MDLNCRWVEGALAVLILVFVIWPTQILSATISLWIVIISAILLLYHSLSCNKCGGVCCKADIAKTAPKSVKAKIKEGKR